jgi:hypothetical protein
VTDVLFVLIVLGFFAVAVLFVQACEGVLGRRDVLATASSAKLQPQVILA